MRFLSIVLWFCVLCLQACVGIQKNEDSTPYAQTQSLSELAGLYKNRAEPIDPNVAPRYLSAILWADENPNIHAEVQTVKVSLLNKDTLEVVAQSASGSEIKATSFVRGQHFELRNGQLEILSKTRVAGSQSGEPMIGITTQNTVLGLDTQGNGKVQEKISATGMAFMVMPIHLYNEANLRFVKLK